MMRAWRVTARSAACSDSPVVQENARLLDRPDGGDESTRSAADGLPVLCGLACLGYAVLPLLSIDVLLVVLLGDYGLSVRANARYAGHECSITWRCFDMLYCS
jgi:hypothetical protein